MMAPMDSCSPIWMDRDCPQMFHLLEVNETSASSELTALKKERNLMSPEDPGIKTTFRIRLTLPRWYNARFESMRSFHCPLPIL